jgi:hypothetical protein
MNHVLGNQAISFREDRIPGGAGLVLHELIEELRTRSPMDSAIDTAAAS